MNDTWIKLYRKITESDVFQDPKAFQLFVWLLISVDKKTGKIKVGRFWLADVLKTNPNTLKDVIKRLEKKYKIITTSSTNKFTEIGLINWAKYQAKMLPTPQGDTNKTPTKHQQNTTIQEYKNKELKNNNIYSSQEYLRTIPEEDLEEFNKKYEASKSDIKVMGEKLYLWCETEKQTKKNYRTFIQNRLLDKHGFRKQTMSPAVSEPMPILTEEQRLKNIAWHEQMRGQLAGRRGMN
jgi:hypothetical protein